VTKLSNFPGKIPFPESCKKETPNLKTFSWPKCLNSGSTGFGKAEKMEKRGRFI